MNSAMCKQTIKNQTTTFKRWCHTKRRFDCLGRSIIIFFVRFLARLYAHSGGSILQRIQKLMSLTIFYNRQYWHIFWWKKIIKNPLWLSIPDISKIDFWYRLCRTKRSLTAWVGVIPKEGSATFGITLTFFLGGGVLFFFFFKSFFWYDNNSDHLGPFGMTQPIQHWPNISSKCAL